MSFGKRVFAASAVRRGWGCSSLEVLPQGCGRVLWSAVIVRGLSNQSPNDNKRLPQSDKPTPPPQQQQQRSQEDKQLSDQLFKKIVDTLQTSVADANKATTESATTESATSSVNPTSAVFTNHVDDVLPPATSTDIQNYLWTYFPMELYRFLIRRHPRGTVDYLVDPLHPLLAQYGFNFTDFDNGLKNSLKDVLYAAASLELKANVYSKEAWDLMTRVLHPTILQYFSGYIDDINASTLTKRSRVLQELQLTKIDYLSVVPRVTQEDLKDDLVFFNADRKWRKAFAMRYPGSYITSRPSKLTTGDAFLIFPLRSITALVTVRVEVLEKYSSGYPQEERRRYQISLEGCLSGEVPLDFAIVDFYPDL